MAEEKSSNGPGLRLGFLIGLVAGLAAAVLFAPPTGEGEPRLESDSASVGPEPLSEPAFAEDSPVGRAMSLIEQVRARMQEASREAGIASREAEELARARYAELTHQEHPKSE